MRFDIITIFPQFFYSYLNESILKRAQEKKLIQINIHNLRDFVAGRGFTRTKRKTTQKFKYTKVDDRPFGGGPGMVLKIEPIISAISSILRNTKSEARNSKQISNSKFKTTRIILFSPNGRQFDNKMAVNLAKNYEQLILICGRYEGIDARVEKIIKNLKIKIENLSIGPYVLTGGELPAMVLIDSISRQIPGVLGKQKSLEEQRYGIGLPVYTRPEVFTYKGKKYKTPKVLLSGNHKKIDEWRRRHRLLA